VNSVLEPSDAALAGRAAKGDDRAFAVLVQRHQEPLYRLLRRYTGDGDEAYEAAHEAFIAAWSALARYDPSRPFGAWLTTIAINKARDRTRRMAFRRAFFGTKGLEDTDEVRARADPARLPLPLREALILTAFEGLSQQEAAVILNVSAKAIETRVYRARKVLAETLDPALRPPN
jgi:RNA polymerase sigma factor (sigma-70 family)